jgi:signal transduction histidine kinase
MSRQKRIPALSSTEFEALSGLMNCSVLLLDRDTNLKFASSHAPGLFGSPDADDLQRRWQEFYKNLQLPELPELQKNSKPLRHRCDVQSSNSPRLLRMEIYPLRHGDCECYLMLVRDRQALSDVEQQIIRASQRQGEHLLTSTLAHDLNAPINTMRITLELISRTPFIAAFGASEDLVTKWERYKGILHEEIGKLKAQVADIPRLFGPAKNVPAVEFDLRAMIHEVARFLKHEITSKRIRLELLLPDYPITVQGGPYDLKLALLNLAISFVEASSHGEHLSIQASSSEMHVVIVFHTDAAQIQAQADFESLTFVSSGSGAGIYVARLLVEAYGGEVQVLVPDDAQGVTVRLLIPPQIAPRESID